MSDETNIIRHWFVLKTMFHAEMRLKKMLESYQNGQIKCFIPMKKAIKKRLHRNEEVLIPAINDLVFVYATKKDVEDFKQYYYNLTNSHAYFLTERRETIINNEKIFKNTIAIVPNVQMYNFIRATEKLDEGVVYYKPEELELEKGQKVRIIGGVYDGICGEIIRRKHKKKKKIVVSVPGVAVVLANISPDLIQIIEEN